jgi:transcriptional antiterminator RfaH
MNGTTDKANLTNFAPNERWYVVQTKPREESKAVFNLERQDFSVFCPRISKIVRHARTVSKVMTPLFPNYVFLAMDIATTQWRKINGTFGVSHLIVQNESPQPVPGGVVEALRLRMNEMGVVDLTQTFRVGQKVRIDTGAFADWVGTLEHLDAKGRVLVLLDMMGRGVPVQLHASEIAPGA